MESIEEFVESLYKGVNGKSQEISSLKEEMKSHLIETVNELKKQGKTEKESLEIAFERFGDSRLISIGLFKLFNKQRKFIKFVLVSAIIFLFIGITSYIYMSQGDLKFQKEQKILTQGVLEIVGDNDKITEDNKLKIEELVNKYNYINYITLFKVEDNPQIQKAIVEDDKMNITGTYRYPFDIKTAELVYPYNVKILTTPEGYDRSTVIATNKKWAVQYEYKKFIYSYVENYSSRIAYSNLDYSTATFNYKNSIYLIIIGGTLLVLGLGFNIYNKLKLVI